MAGGPIYPCSAVPDSSGRAFPNIYKGAGGNAAPWEEGLGYAASLSADTVWYLRYPVPPTVPTGTLKLRLLGLATGSTGVAKLTVSDANVAAGSSPSAATLTGETQTTLTFTTPTTDDKYQEAKIPLTAAPAGNDMLVVALTGNTSGWTLAAVLTLLASILWE